MAIRKHAVMGFDAIEYVSDDGVSLWKASAYYRGDIEEISDEEQDELEAKTTVEDYEFPADAVEKSFALWAGLTGRDTYGK